MKGTRFVHPPEILLSALIADSTADVVSDAAAPKKMGKAEMEQLIKSHGGKIYQTKDAVSDTHIIGDRSKASPSSSHTLPGISSEIH